MELAQNLYREAEPHINHVLVITDHAFVSLQSQIYRHADWVQQTNRFQKFLLLNGFLIGIVVLFKILNVVNPLTLFPKISNYVLNTSMVTNKVRDYLQKNVKRQFLESVPKKFRSTLKKIPYNPVDEDPGLQCDLESLKGYLSGSRYPDKKHSDFVINLSKQFSYSNPLHFDLHPYLKQMEVQVIKMCANLLKFHNQDNEAVGGFFSGGTQSILMAILAYRQYGRKNLNITNPNIVVCQTGHAAALKAADMFCIEVKKIKTDANYSMSVSAMKKAIDNNTICVYTSYPNYPYGTIDPIDEIAEICRKKKIPIHLDMCLGGFLVPFLKNQKGQRLFEIPKGVTSISMDCHKYGLSAKGASVLLFSSQKYRREHFFVTKQWPGGYYGTVGIAGSRSGTTIASAWISMMKVGNKGYEKNAKNIQTATTKLAEELRNLGFKVFGYPSICCIGFSHPKYPPNLIKHKMKQKQWDLPLLQKPIALHYSFTPINSVKIDQMIADFRAVMSQITKLQKQGKLEIKKEAEYQLYGACAKIPNVGTKNLILYEVLDMFYEI